MNLIDEVAKLKELEGKMFPGKYHVEEGARCDDYVVANGRAMATVPKQQYTGQGRGEIWPTFKNADGFAALRNAAPNLLAVLGGFQAGDVKLLDGIIRYLIEDFVEGEHSCQMVAWLMTHSEDTSKDMIDLLRRYRDMAQAMEEHR